MIAMERKETRVHRIGGNSLEEIAEGLRAVAPRIAKVVERKGRKLEEGPVLSRLAALFLLLAPEDQAEIIAMGHEAVEHLRRLDDPPHQLEGAAAEAVRAEVFGNRALLPNEHRPRSSGGSSLATHLGEAKHGRVDREDTPGDGGDRVAERKAPVNRRSSKSEK